MLGWIVRILLVVAGAITGLFVARDVHQFEIMRMMVAIFLFVLGVAAAAFWPAFMEWIERQRAARK